MRLIDADALWSDIQMLPHNGDIISSEEVEHEIADAPTIVEQFVQCMNCVRWKKDVPGCTDFVGRCEIANYMVGATGYCVYAKQKEA
jgi:hypothetical protein